MLTALLKYEYFVQRIAIAIQQGNLGDIATGDYFVLKFYFILI